jgi:hypothetical protein
MHMRRFTRLTTGYSKKVENHMHMVALYTVWYNWIRTHKAHRMTPAMAAGLTDKLMDMADVARLIDDAKCGLPFRSGWRLLRCLNRTETRPDGLRPGHEVRFALRPCHDRTQGRG